MIAKVRGRRLVVVGLLGGLVMAGIGVYDLIDGTKKLNDARTQLLQQLADSGLTPEKIGLSFTAGVSFGL